MQVHVVRVVQWKAVWLQKNAKGWSTLRLQRVESLCITPAHFFARLPCVVFGGLGTKSLKAIWLFQGLSGTAKAACRVVQGRVLEAESRQQVPFCRLLFLLMRCVRRVMSMKAFLVGTDPPTTPLLPFFQCLNPENRGLNLLLSKICIQSASICIFTALQLCVAAELWGKNCGCPALPCARSWLANPQFAP